MRVKVFHAPTAAEAMRLVRDGLGDDAVILSTKDDGRDGMAITAAVESDLAEDALTEAIGAAEPLNGGGAPDESLTAEANTLIRALAYHGVPTPLAERLFRSASANGSDALAPSLAGVIDATFNFAPLTAAPQRPCMLVGPAGVGKTVAVAKIATRAVLAGLRVAVMTTDTTRAGGVDQLAVFTNVLKLDLLVIDRGAELGRAVQQAAEAGSVVIDSFGVNPHRDDELATLKDLIGAAGAEPILVLAAGGDPAEQAEVAERFADLGVHRLLITRLDEARRFGGVLGAADAAGLWFSDASISPYVGQGLHGLSPASLARLLLRDPAEGEIIAAFDKAEP